MTRPIRLVVLTLAAVTVAPSHRAAADEIPAFARRYGVSCRLCHSAAPRLSPFGEAFAGNGFRMAASEPPRDTISTGDPLLELMRDLPLAIRLDAYVNAYANGDVSSDLQTPYNLKILSGGPISNKLSYYLYFFLFERGEVGGIEDAFIYVNDVLGQPIDVAVGQFQVSDPMFKRELRLEYQDYAIYRARIGLQPADLTYDRGIMAVADAAGFTITAEVVNGNGKGEAEANRRLDNDPLKNVFAHVSREIVPSLRLGAMGYYGRQDGAAAGGPTVRSDVWMLGGDATVAFGMVEINAQYIHREDDLPTFTPGEAPAVTDGGIAEVVIQPPGSRWYGVALYNLVETDRPLLDVRLGGPTGLTRYETASAGVGHLLRRNFRVFAEGTWDFEQDGSRWTLGFSTAF